MEVAPLEATLEHSPADHEEFAALLESSNHEDTSNVDSLVSLVADLDVSCVWKVVRDKIFRHYDTWDLLMDRMVWIRTDSTNDGISSLLEEMNQLLKRFQLMLEECTELPKSAKTRTLDLSGPLQKVLEPLSQHSLKAKNEISAEYQHLFSDRQNEDEHEVKSEQLNDWEEDSEPWPRVEDLKEDLVDAQKEEFEEGVHYVKLGRGDSRRYECTVCNVKVFHFKRLKDHKCRPARSRAQWVRVQVEGEKRFVCATPDCSIGIDACPAERQSWCKTAGVWKHFLDCHATAEDLIYPCDKCEERFPTKTVLTMHRLRAHPKTISCSFCGRGFTEAKSLRCHELRHTGEKPCKCPECDYVCVNKSMLNSHMKRHTRSSCKLSKDALEKAHVCEVCGKTFKTTVGLREHAQAQHGMGMEGEPPRTFLCGQCGKSLKSNSGFRRHLVKVHGVKFTCDQCGKDFSSEQWMHIHRRDVHGVQI